MEEEKIDRILKLVDMLEVTDENRDDIAKVKKLIEQKKYAEMLEVLKKVTSKNETKIKEDNRTILFRNEEKEEKENNKTENKDSNTNQTNNKNNNSDKNNNNNSNNNSSNNSEKIDFNDDLKKQIAVAGEAYVEFYFEYGEGTAPSAFAEQAYEDAKNTGEPTDKHSTQSTSEGSSLPKTGTPYSSKDLEDSEGVKQRRYYDKNGNADMDIDYRHGGTGHTFPHRHDWNNGVRGPAY